MRATKLSERRTKSTHSKLTGSAINGFYLDWAEKRPHGSFAHGKKVLNWELLFALVQHLGSSVRCWLWNMQNRTREVAEKSCTIQFAFKKRVSKGKLKKNIVLSTTKTQICENDVICMCITCRWQPRSVSLQGDIANCWPGMLNTTFLVIFVNLCVHRTFSQHCRLYAQLFKNPKPYLFSF